MQRRPPDDGLHEECLELLQGSEARFRNIIEKNADGVVVVDASGTIRYVNPAAEAILDRKAETLPGQPFGVPVFPGETTEIDLPQGGEVRTAELRVVETEWEGEPASLVSLRDVTGHKRLEEELRRRAEALVEADRQKDDFLAMLAHELRNPLAPIRNASSILRLAAPAPGDLERARSVIEQQVGHLTRLIDDLLDVSRITRGKIALKRRPIDLVDVIDRSVASCRPIFERAGIELDVEVKGASLGVDGDATRIEQILTNLLNNAAKFTPAAGHVRLSAAREGGWIELRVVDDGVGIEPAMLPRIFDLFAQADRSLERTQGGLGIGLTLVRRLAEMHDGSVEARSDGDGLGAEFVVRFPSIARDADSPQAPSEPPRSGTPDRPLRVLVVDDNRHAAETLAMLLKAWGHEPIVAFDGPTGLESALTSRPDAVLLDIGLPLMDGYSVARALRGSDGIAPELLLVAMTGYGQEQDRRRALDGGFDHHMVKPIDLDFLERLLAEKAPRSPTNEPGAG